MNLFKRMRNRRLAKQEHENIEFLYELGFNEELQNRLEYKERLLKNQLVEMLDLDLNDSVDLVYLNSFIKEKQMKNEIDEFYNIVKK